MGTGYTGLGNLGVIGPIIQEHFYKFIEDADLKLRLLIKWINMPRQGKQHSNFVASNVLPFIAKRSVYLPG